MNAPFHVTCAIPRSGRTLNNFLQKLVDLGASSKEIDAILQILSQSKSRSSLKLEEALNFLVEVRTKAPSCFSVFVDRKRFHRPYRLGFLGYDWQIGPYKLRVEGEEPHNGSSLIRLDEVDFTVVGLDELLSMTQYYLRDPSRVTKWGMYNYHLDKPTGIRIAGSAMLCSYNEVLQTEIQDIVGFFLISKVSERKHPLNLKTLSRFGQQVFVKGRYTGIVMAAYPKLNIVSVEDVEDAVLAGEKGCVGLEIVQSGSTVKRKGLFLHGGPLFLSESLYVVDYDRYVSSEVLQNVIELLNPVGYFEEARLKQFARWYRALEINLGSAWTDKPPITELFCESSDSEHGLRPYRLKTRHWKPSDTYQRDQAQQGIDRAHKQLLGYYQKICAEYPIVSV
jgi:hypothetical protein